jgi:hypothetical protein
MANIPFWRPTPAAAGPPNPQTSGDGLIGPPNDTLAGSDGTQAWERFLVNSKPLPGLVKVIKAPPLQLHEVFSKAQNKDAQVRKILGLKSPEFAVRCWLLTSDHWDAWQDMLPLLLPVEKADGRGEVRAISSPIVNIQRITYAYVFNLDPVQVPEAGGPACWDIHWRAWWPATAANRAGKAGKTLKDPAQTATPTIDVAQSVPGVPQLSSFQRPTPARLRP